MKLIKHPSLKNDSYSEEKLYGPSLSASFPEGRGSCGSSCGQRRLVNLSLGRARLPSPWNCEQLGSQGQDMPGRLFGKPCSGPPALSQPRGLRPVSPALQCLCFGTLQ